MDKLEKMIKMIKHWLKKNELDSDLHFISVPDWIAKGNEFHHNAELVIITEGELNFMLNYGAAEDIDEFDDLVESFGYYYELGNTWNLGIYKIEDYSYTDNPNVSYSQKLQDVRWLVKSKNVKLRAGNKCEDCGAKTQLEAHHCYYMYNFAPWEYPFDSIRCLCKPCHQLRGDTEWLLRSRLASMTTNDLSVLIELLDTGQYWYPNLFKFLSTFGYDDMVMAESFVEMLKNKHVNE